jgi:hypothetical protein
MVFYKKKSYCRTTHKSRAAAFELESETELSTENARLAYQLSRGESRYIKDKITEMELKVQSAKDKQTLDESIYTRNKIKSLEISEVDFERFELAFKSSKLNYESLKAISTTKSTIEK